VLAVTVAALAGGAPAATPLPPLNVKAYADTGIALADVLWTGKQFLLVENTANTVWTAGPTATSPQKWAQMPNLTEETRCRLSPGAHGFGAGEIFCHAPDNTIYRITPDGNVTPWVKLPETATSDGALVFDTVGKFGYALVAATGRSGGDTPTGGTLYAIPANGQVQTIATYPGPGGADQVAIAPATFGTAAGSAILTVDAGPKGTLLAIDPKGGIRTLARLPDGPNPIVVVSRSPTAAKSPPPGLYVTDTASHKLFFVSADQLATYTCALLVGTELKAQLWLVRPHGKGFQTRLLKTDLPAASYNLEGAAYIPGP